MYLDCVCAHVKIDGASGERVCAWFTCMRVARYMFVCKQRGGGHEI